MVNHLTPRKYTVLNGNFVFDLCCVFQEYIPGIKVRPACTLSPLCIMCVTNMFTLSSCVIVTLRKRNVFVSKWVSKISSH